MEKQEKKKVYIVLECDVFDYVVTNLARLVTTDKEKAIAEWKKLLETTVNEYQECYDLEDIVMDIDEIHCSFDFYRIGRSCELNNKCWIETKEID